MICTVQYSSSTCKNYIETTINEAALFAASSLDSTATGDLFYLLITPGFICGYIFNFCGDLKGSTYYTQLKVDDYAN